MRAATGREVDPADVATLLADPGGAEPEDDVVEETVDRLLVLAGLPPTTRGGDDDAPAG